MEPIIRLSLVRRRKNLLDPTYAIEYAYVEASSIGAY